MDTIVRYVICRFVADVIRDEPINIGVILHNEAAGYTDCAFNRNFLRRTDPDRPVYLGVIESLEERFAYEARFSSDLTEEDRKDPYLLDRMIVGYSNQIQFTSPRALLSENIAQTKEHLYSTYVARTGEQRPQSRDVKWVRRELRRLIAEKGAQEKVRSDVVIVDPLWGTPIDLDFQWLNGRINFVKALSLENLGVRMFATAKLWRENFDLVRSRSEYTSAEITTVVYPPTGDRANYEKALAILEDRSRVIEFSRAETIIDQIAQQGHVIS